jgi:chemotaxis protein methyltransferase CheR
LIINPPLQEQFIQLIAAYTGLKVRSQDCSMLNRSILERVKALHLKSPQHYYDLLSQSAIGNPKRHNSEAEWDVLKNFITTGESYFWRDHGQLKVLSEYVLPEVIQAKRAKAKQGDRPQLRLWSAGCSTGEEPYTLAIMLQDLIPDLPQWDILLLGTDLNPEVICKAKQGIYRQWSFRQTPVDFRQRHFESRSGTWQVNDTIRQAVTFRCGNLLQDDFPSASGIHSMDLILCRNVFIYFHAESIAAVLQKFYNTLNPSGYLMCGHAELQAQDLSAFQLFSFPKAITYQRPVGKVQAPVILAQSTPALHRSKTFILSVDHRPSNHPLKPLSPAESDQPKAAKTHSAVSAIAQPALSSKSEIESAQVHFNQGQYVQALQSCQKALLIEPNEIAPLYLQAQISVALEDFKQAKTLFKKIIYLSPNEIAAYLELGALYSQEGNQHRAHKTYAAAKQVLQDGCFSAIPKYQDFLTLGELSNFIEQQLK